MGRVRPEAAYSRRARWCVAPFNGNVEAELTSLDYTPRYARDRLGDLFGLEAAEKMKARRYQILK